MATIKTPVELSLSRISSNQDSTDGKFALRITDKTSRIGFFEVYITPEQLTDMLTRRYVNAEATVRGAEKVGKQHVSESRSVVCPLDTCDKNVLRQWINDNCQEDGWEIFSYLGSQNSIVYNGDGTRKLSYSVYKYVDVI